MNEKRKKPTTYEIVSLIIQALMAIATWIAALKR